MPQLEIVSVEEAQGGGRYVADYVALIQQVPARKAGKTLKRQGYARYPRFFR
jgi:hypothetical protein